MRQSEAKEFLPLIQAFAEGKTIQVKSVGGWVDSKELVFNWPVGHYRIKPEPRTFYAVEWHNNGRPVIAGSLYQAEEFVREAIVGVPESARVIILREVLDD